MYHYFSEISPDEKILWQGKPDKMVTLIENIFHKTSKIFLFLLVLDSFLIYSIINAKKMGASISPSVYITLLIPNCILLSTILSATFQNIINYRNCYFVITRHYVHIFQGSHGVLHYSYPIRALSSHSVKRSFCDLFFDVGDIVLDFNIKEKVLYNGMAISQKNKNSVKEHQKYCSKKPCIFNIKQYEYVYNIILQEFNAYQEAVGNQTKESTIITSAIDDYKDLYHHITSMPGDSYQRFQSQVTLNETDTNQLLSNSWGQPVDIPNDVDGFFLNLDDDKKKPIYSSRPSLSEVDTPLNNPYNTNNPYALDPSIPANIAPKHVFLEPYI